MRAWEHLARACAAVGAGPRPILVIDDAHWLDAATVRGLRFILRRLRDGAPSRPRWRVLVLSRPAVGDNAAIRDVAGPRTPRLELSPLGRADGERLVRSLLPAAGEEVVAALAGRARGHPLFLVELARGAGAGAGSAGADEALPATVHSAVAERLEALAAPVRRVAECGAVLGGEGTAGLVAAVAGTSTAASSVALDELAARGLLAVTAAGHRFASPVVEAASLAVIPAARRRLLHRRAAVALARAPEQALAAVAHARASGDAVLAARAASRAATLARRRGDRGARPPGCCGPRWMLRPWARTACWSSWPTARTTRGPPGSWGCAPRCWTAGSARSWGPLERGRLRLRRARAAAATAGASASGELRGLLQSWDPLVRLDAALLLARVHVDRGAGGGGRRRARRGRAPVRGGRRRSGSGRRGPQPCRAVEVATAFGPGGGAGATTVNLELVFDASGSMAERIGGESKIDAARRAVAAAAGALPAGSDNLNVGFRVFGHRGDSTEAGRSESCSSTELPAPLAPADPAGLVTAAATFGPTGWTPISLALEQAGGDFSAGEAVRNSIILVTDGEETCDGDPCAVAAALAAADVALRVDLVGFGVSPGVADLLSCVPAATGGVYLDAADGDALVAAVTELIAASVSRCTLALTAVDPDGPTADLVVEVTDAAGQEVSLIEGLDEQGSAAPFADGRQQLEVPPGEYTVAWELVNERLGQQREHRGVATATVAAGQETPVVIGFGSVVVTGDDPDLRRDGSGRFSDLELQRLVGDGEWEATHFQRFYPGEPFRLTPGRYRLHNIAAEETLVELTVAPGVASTVTVG